MELTEDKGHGKYQIKSYEPGQLVINDQTYTQSVIVSSSKLNPLWHPQSVKELQAEDFLPVLELNPEVVLLGTGAKQIFPNPEILLPLTSRNIGIEIMDTRVACHTFVALTAEGRNVVAALIIR